VAEGDLAARTAQRDAWLREVDPVSLFHPLFDHIPGVFFFAKNRVGEMMFLSRGNREIYGITDEAGVIGLTDFDLCPTIMAAGYVRDDARVMTTGTPIVGRVELWFNSQGIPAWYTTTKLPICSRTGEVIGVMGVSQETEGRARGSAPWGEIEPAVQLIRERYRQALSVTDLADVAGLSVRQLERKFRAALNLTLQTFLVKTRVLAACRVLRETDEPLSAVAAACGFYDQSAFSEQFRRYVGQTPLRFRKAVRGR
jgi:AraC-like DNA-binding protein